MRTPQKTSLIYQQLRREILHRKYLPGSLLPKEMELAEQLNISRVTVRSALKKLVGDQLIRRVSGCGTFVSDTIERPRITFLLPCADQRVFAKPFISDIFQGILQGVMENDCEIEVLPVSPSNDPEDIDLSRFFNLNEKSRIIISGTWFKKMFPMLLQNQCRVAVIMDESRLNFPYKKEYGSWIWMSKNIRKNNRRMVHALAEHQCRRPLFMLRYLDDPIAYLKEDILDCFQELWPGQTPAFALIPQKDFSPQVAEKLIREHFSGQGYDGILVNHPMIFRALRKVHPEVLCGMFDLMQHPRLNPDEHTFYSEFPLMELGRRAVQELLQDSVQGQFFNYQAEIHQGTGE